MGKINQLDKSVYNRLSAGEVVENPASIVKELVENSVDAGASNLVVMIEDGGIKSITVIDDGCGIEPDDLPVAILPHATSKISCAEDLETIATLGFRGEALASIAAVSTLELKSHFVESEMARYIIVKGGDVVEEGDCALSSGTTIKVSNLFYNTPVRYKFLKPIKGEENNVTRLIHELMLANPDVSIKYYVDGAMVGFSNGSGMDDALCAALGEVICDNMLYFDIAEKNYTVTGYVGRPATEAILSNRNKQIFIVNGRVFIDANLPSVIQNAYGERLMKRTFPAAVIDIVMPFDEVDVNVHPGKKEVRFADKKLLNGMIYSAIKKVLEKDQEEREEEMRLGMLLTNETKKDITLTLERVMDVVDDQEEGIIVGDVSKQKIKELMKKYDIHEDDLGPIKKEIELPDPLEGVWKIPPKDWVYDPVNGYKAPIGVGYDVLLSDMEPTALGQLAQNPYKYPLDKMDDTSPSYVDEEEAIQERETLDGIVRDYELGYVPVEEENIRKRFRIVGQVFDTYIIVESGKKLLIIDQHAAHERILYDTIMKAAHKDVRVQNIMVPYNYTTLSDEELQVFRDNEKSLWKLGFGIEITENNVLQINAIPVMLEGMDIDQFVYSVIENGGEIKCFKDIGQIQSRIAKIACRSAIKGGMKLTNSEIDYVMEYFLEKGMPLQCPHGRPTVVIIDKSNVEKWFKRII